MAGCGSNLSCFETNVERGWLARDLRHVASASTGAPAAPPARPLSSTGPNTFSVAPPAQETRADVPEAMCDDCAYFDEETNWCSIREMDTRFDNNACRYFGLPAEQAGAQDDAPTETEAKECAECR